MVIAGFGASAQPPKPPTPPSKAVSEDAVPIYRACWPKLTSDLNIAAGEVTFNAKGPAVAPGSPAGSWEKVAGMLRANQAVVKDLMRAAALDRCEFNLAPPDPKAPDANLQPVLDVGAKLRASARLLRADAARAWAAGETSAAADRVAAMYGLGLHGSREAWAILAMTDQAIIMLANDTARTMAAGAGGRVPSAAQKERLRKAIDRLDPNDPAGLVRAGKADPMSDPKMAAQYQQLQPKLRDDLAKTRRALGGQ